MTYPPEFNENYLYANELHLDKLNVFIERSGNNPMFLEIKIRQNGQEKWVDARKFFDYMIKEYSKVKYSGKKIDPYEDRVNKFYDNIPQNLLDMWR